MDYFQEQKNIRVFLMETRKEILSIESLLIGFLNGKSKKILLPPLKASALHGELIALIGQNGIGKSTFLRTIARLQKPLGGRIELNGKLLTGYTRNELARNIGFISTEPLKVSNMTVEDLVTLGRFPYTNWIGRLTDEDKDIINVSIGKVGMKDFSKRYINELSDGERQRAMVARVLAQDSDLLIMDEPTAFLDIKSKYEIIHLLHELSGKRNKTIIFSTHDLNVALSEADKIWLLLEDHFSEGAPEDLILKGDFDRLFNDSFVKFDNAQGNFVFRSDKRGEININGSGNERTWTEKALNRAGYSVTEQKAEIVIEIGTDNQGKTIWIAAYSDGRVTFDTIYDLIAWLCSEIS
jgi:iron complex transport system ATP-binding protein